MSLVSCLDAFHQIVRDEGLLSLWNGTFPSLLLVFNPAIQFMFYEGLKRQLLKKRMKVIPDFESSRAYPLQRLVTWIDVICSVPASQLSSLDVFIIGAVSKAIATTVTYPMQTVQSILRVSAGLLPPFSQTTLQNRGFSL